jgi:hypothetical protein
MRTTLTQTAENLEVVLVEFVGRQVFAGVVEQFPQFLAVLDIQIADGRLHLVEVERSLRLPGVTWKSYRLH